MGLFRNRKRSPIADTNAEKPTLTETLTEATSLQDKNISDNIPAQDIVLDIPNTVSILEPAVIHTSDISDSKALETNVASSSKPKGPKKASTRKSQENSQDSTKPAERQRLSKKPKKSDSNNGDILVLGQDSASDNTTTVPMLSDKAPKQTRQRSKKTSPPEDPVEPQSTSPDFSEQDPEAKEPSKKRKLGWWKRSKT